FHLIICLRSKMEYAQEQGADGKQTVRKLGMGAVQDGTLEYEMQVAIVLDSDHRIDLSKTRANTLAGKSWQANQEGDFARLYKAWLNAGVDVVPRSVVDALQSSQGVLPPGERAEYRAAFREVWGAADELDPDKLPAVWKWVIAMTGVKQHDFDQESTERWDY